MLKVYAQQDVGPMSELTRWKPRRVLCSLTPANAAEAPSEHVVKYRQQGPVGVCALISEVVGGLLLRAAGLLTVEPRLVFASPEFVDRCNREASIAYALVPGWHFGTSYIRGEGGPVIRLGRLTHPQQVIDLWVMDCWLCTIDRKNEGNTLLVPVASGGYSLYAIDQSDCFGGAGRLADGSWAQVLRSDRGAEDAGCLTEAILSCGGQAAVETALFRVEAARTSLDAVFGEVPAEWWQEAGLAPGQFRNELERRVDRLRAIVKPENWGGAGLGGGVLLGGGGP